MRLARITCGRCGRVCGWLERLDPADLMAAAVEQGVDDTVEPDTLTMVWNHRQALPGATAAEGRQWRYGTILTAPETGEPPPGWGIKKEIFNVLIHDPRRSRCGSLPRLVSSPGTEVPVPSLSCASCREPIAVSADAIAGVLESRMTAKLPTIPADRTPLR